MRSKHRVEPVRVWMEPCPVGKKTDISRTGELMAPQPYTGHSLYGGRVSMAEPCPNTISGGRFKKPLTKTGINNIIINMQWTTQQRKIDELIPYSNNPRTLTEKQAEDLKASLSKFNLAEIPAINQDNTILAGHQRLKILQQLGKGGDTVDVRVPDRMLSEKEVQEYNIRSNRNTGEWDFDILSNEFDIDNLKEWGFQDTDFGFSIDGAEDGFELPDGEKEPFQQITFTLADEQAEFIKQKIDGIKKTDNFKYCETFGNENSNGNALYCALRG